MGQRENTQQDSRSKSILTDDSIKCHGLKHSRNKGEMTRLYKKVRPDCMQTRNSIHIEIIEGLKINK